MYTYISINSGPCVNYLMALTGLMETVSMFYLCPPEALALVLIICLRAKLPPLLHTELLSGNMTVIESTSDHLI